MSEESNEEEFSFFAELGRELREVGQAVSQWLHNSGVYLRNAVRQARGARLDYVVVRVGGTLPERAGRPRNFIQRQLLPPDPLSLEELSWRFKAIAEADNVHGVIIVFYGLAAGLATVQSIRRAITRLRAAGKEVVAFTPYLDLSHYYAATAANRVVAPPGLHFELLGLRSEAVFLRDALAQLGVQADVVRISPYKTAGNTLAESDMTAEQRKQVEWILNDTFEMVTADIAADRGLDPADFRRMVDEAPFFSDRALALRLVDDVAYEDELPALLARDNAGDEVEPDNEPEAGAVAPPDSDATFENGGRASDSNDGKPPTARIMPWSRARDMLMEKERRRVKKHIGVVSLEGMITMGVSHQPPIDLPIPFMEGMTAGATTIGQLLRQAEQDDAVAAIVFHVESGGGDALASDLIWREVRRINEKKPVVVFMGNVAASGGYYAGAAGRHIMAQSGTITGSIGVVTVRLSTAGLYDKIRIKRVTVKRGEHADLYADDGPLTEAQRAILWQTIIDLYDRFKSVVSEGRAITDEELEPIAGGRVWTGRQALGLKLVDSHGDMEDAIRLAGQLAGLDPEAGDEVFGLNVYPRERGYLLPRPYEPAAQVARFLAGEWLQQWSGRPLYLMPHHWRFR
jgi:protease-4